MEFALVEGKERNAIVDLSRMEASAESGNTRKEESAVLHRRSLIGAGELQIAALASPGLESGGSVAFRGLLLLVSCLLGNCAMRFFQRHFLL
ncbi:hypothetical protein ACSQ67_011484 [Phaseolus vulgaris]